MGACPNYSKGHSISKVNQLGFTDTEKNIRVPVMANRNLKCSTLDMRLSSFAGHCLPVITLVHVHDTCVLMALS